VINLNDEVGHVKVPTSILPATDEIARTLAQRQVDPNEVAKCFAHLRVLVERAGDDEKAQRAAADEWCILVQAA
jgi:hypothetical protein